jgi:hypothetical protein
MGIKIVAVWESHSRDPAYFSHSQGYHDAATAYGEARAIGQPAGSAIYFAVDFNALWLQPIDEYFRGVAAGLAAAAGGHADYAVGVYGSGMVCDALKRSGLARYCWLSNAFAWAGSTEYEDWNIRQGNPSPGLSFNHDSDEARNEYGAFQVPGSGIATRYAGDVTAPRTPLVADTGVVTRSAAGDLSAPSAAQTADSGVASRPAAGDVTAAPAPHDDRTLAFADVPLRDAEGGAPTEHTRRHSHHRGSVLRYAEARTPAPGGRYLRVQYAVAAGKTVRHRVASGAPSSVSTAARHKAKCGVARCASNAASSR